MITFSMLPRLLECPASAALPRHETYSADAAAGNANHDRLARFGDLPDELRALLPPDPISEVKLAYDVATRRARIIGAGRGRAYGPLGPFEIAGSVDALGLEKERAVVLDWKTGALDVDPAARNHQLWGYALAASRAFGRDEALVRIVYTAQGNRVDEHAIDALELAAFADRLERLHGQVAFAIAQRRDGIEPDTVEGPWCRYCPAKQSCPSKTGLLRIIAHGGTIGQLGREMTPGQARIAYQQIVALEGIVKDARKRAERYVDENGPIDLGDGRAFGRYERKGNEKVDAAIASRAIREVCGERADDVADVALEISTSKAAIERAAASIGDRQLAKRILGRARELGGITSEVKRPVGEFSVGRNPAVMPEPFPVEDIDSLIAERSE